MSVNFSGNASRHAQASYKFMCTDPISGHIFFALMLVNFFVLLPLSIFILYLGFQRLKRQHSASSSAAVSLSDFVTYNMAAMELIGVVGNTVAIYGSFFSRVVMWVGIFTGMFPWYGQMFFPVLACMERYLAVVHPITYMRLRQGSGVRIRNITTLCIWLMCFAWMPLTSLALDFYRIGLIVNTCQMSLYLIATTFCSLSILCVLTRPRPGEVGGARAQVDQSKQRAFYTIAIVMAVLLLRFGGNLVCNVMSLSETVSHGDRCVAIMLGGWFNVPSSLVLPLLFLHRDGKLPRCKH